MQGTGNGRRAYTAGGDSGGTHGDYKAPGGCGVCQGGLGACWAASLLRLPRSSGPAGKRCPCTWLQALRVRQRQLTRPTQAHMLSVLGDIATEGFVLAIVGHATATALEGFRRLLVNNRYPVTVVNHLTQLVSPTEHLKSRSCEAQPAAVHPACSMRLLCWPNLSCIRPISPSGKPSVTQAQSVCGWSLHVGL